MTVSRFSITDFAVKRWQFTLIVFAMLTALGLSSLNAIPKSEDPTFPLPLFVIVAVLPGASPSDLEQLVVDPIEERIQTLDELDHVQTEIRDQLAVIRVEFEAGVDVSRKEDEVRREIDMGASDRRKRRPEREDAPFRSAVPARMSSRSIGRSPPRPLAAGASTLCVRPVLALICRNAAPAPGRAGPLLWRQSGWVHPVPAESHCDPGQADPYSPHPRYRQPRSVTVREGQPR